MTTTDTVSERLDRRYGRTRSPRARIIGWTIAGVIVLAFALWYGWGVVSAAARSVEAVDTGYEVVDERTVTVTFQVTAPADTAFACAVEAQDVDHAIVGWKVVEVPASADRIGSMRVEVPTVAEATTGLVNRCWVP